MKRSIVLGLVAVMGLLWGCDDGGKTTDPPVPQKTLSANAVPGLWAGRLVHYVDDTTSEVGEIYVAFTDSTFVTWPAYFWSGQCNSVWGMGRWSTNGFHMAMQNDSGATFGCEYVPLDSDSLRGFIENDTLYILDAPFIGGPFNDPLLYRDSVVLARVQFLDSVVASGNPSPISRTELIGTWQGEYLHFDSVYTQESGIYAIELKVSDTNFIISAGSMYSYGHCPPLYAWGTCDVIGFTFYRQNYAIYAQNCGWYPFFWGFPPVWLEGDTLVMLENPVYRPVDITKPVFLDTMRVVKVD